MPCYLEEKRCRGISVYAEELREAVPRQLTLLPEEQRKPKQTILAIEQVLARIDQEIEPYRPKQEINPAELSTEAKYYYEVRDKMTEIRNALDMFFLSRGRKAAYRVKIPAKQMRARRSKKRFRHLSHADPTLQEIWAVQDVRDYLKSLVQHSKSMAVADKYNLLEFLHQTALLQVVADTGPERLHQHAVLSAQVIGGETETLTRFLEMFQKLADELSFTSMFQGENQLVIKGQLAYQLLRYEAGGHLFLRKHGGLELVCLEVQDFPPGNAGILADRGAGILRLPEVIRVYDEEGMIFDRRTGLLLKAKALNPDDRRMLLFSQLPLPKELQEYVESDCL